MNLKNKNIEYVYSVTHDRHPLHPYTLTACGWAKSAKKHKKGDRVTVFCKKMKSLENCKVEIVWDNEEDKDNEYYLEAQKTMSLIVYKMTENLKHLVEYDSRYNDSGTLNYPLHPDRLKNKKIKL